jgi:hypothetical protein
MCKIRKLTVRRTKRTDAIILLRATYEGDPHSDPKAYNRIYADILRHMADAILKVTDAWVDPEVVVWMHKPGEITAAVPLSPPEKQKRISRKK